MIFVYPEVLFLLILLFFLFFFIKSKKTIRLENVFSKEVLEKLEIKTSKVFSKNFKFYLSSLVLILMIIALARPVILENKEANEIKYDSFNLSVILDISKSMQAKDVFPNRLEFAKKSLLKLMEEMAEANIAVLAFANDAFLLSPFSNDFKSIEFLLQNLNTDSLSTKGSQIISALKASQKVFDSTDDEKKVVLLISDGADGQELDKISSNIKENNFVLHVLNIGTKKGITLEDGFGGFIKDKDGNIVISKRDDSIAQSAKQSGGAFLSLTNDMSKLSWLSTQIKSTVQKKETKKDKYEGSIELFYYPLSLALFLLFFVFNSPRVPFMVFLLLINTNVKADMFDFFHKYKASESYKAKEYEKAQEYFSKIDKDEALYNKANALYKQEKYEEALKTYESIKEFKEDKELQRLYNIGNSYAKLKKIDKAISAYEQALKIKDDEDAKHNLELLKKQQKQEQKKQNKKNEDKKEEKKDNQKAKEDDKKQDKKEDTQNKREKEKSKEEEGKQNSEQKPKESEKKISEAEAKKWEKKMENKKFTTRPMKLESGQGRTNEITW